MAIEVNNETYTVTMTTDDYVYLRQKAQKNLDLENAAICAWILLNKGQANEQQAVLLYDEFSHYIGSLQGELDLLRSV